jgi:hypothetical protein
MGGRTEMATIYHIEITNGVITFDHAAAPRVANEYHAPNAKQYFAKRGKEKPAPIAVRGWPFDKIYMTHGTEENGLAVAWA